MINASKIIILFLVFLSIRGLAQDVNGRVATVPTIVATKIAVISIQNAVIATNDGRKVFEALDKRFEPQKNQIKNLNEEIDRLKKQLDTQANMMNDEARGDLTRQIDGKQRMLGRIQEDAQSDYAGQQNEAVQKVLKKLLLIVDKYAKDNGLSLVVDGSKSWPDWPVLWASSSIDITQAVVAIYNAQPTVADSNRQSAPNTKNSISSPKSQGPAQLP